MNVNSCKSNDAGSADCAQLERPYNMEQLVRRCMGKIELAERLLKVLNLVFQRIFPKSKTVFASMTLQLHREWYIS